MGEDGAVRDGGGTVGGACTAPDPQAEAARMTKIPANASLIRETLRLSTSLLTLPLAVKFPMLRLANAGRPACCDPRVRQGQDR
jgi:hypothetical protein